MELPEWELRDGKLHRELAFADLTAAFAFMTAVASKMDHHPEWFNVYNKVRVDLVTHDAGGISAKDVAMAREMDRLMAAQPRA